MIKFSCGINNKKLRALAEHLKIPYSHVYSFDLPAGYTCPAANICKTFANPATRKIVDARGSKVRCYAASMEVLYSKLSRLHWQNYLALKGKTYYEMLDLLEAALPKNAEVIRIHASGDFFNFGYFFAWLQLAKNHPEISFYGYSKSIIYNALERKNFHLIYSHGGKRDDLADTLNIPQVYMVRPEDTIIAPVICNKQNEWMDYEYIIQQKSFSIVIHGIQPKKGK